MKSTKAREFIDYKVRKGSDCPEYDVVQAGEIESAIEIAEQEMREKAIRCFSSFVSDYCYEAGYTNIYNNCEHHIAVFTKALE